MEAIARLLRAPLPQSTYPSLDAFVDDFVSLEDTEPEKAPAATRSFARAVLGGARADRLGFAFVAGYRAAIACLGEGADLSRPLPARVCLAVTEAGGGHPRAMTTKLAAIPGNDDRLRLDGEKTFATLASASDVLLVLAREGEDEAGRPRLRLVRVGARATGVTITKQPETPFAPEVPHARVTFEGVTVSVDDVLAGDGYARYLKPFRTLEDEHVLAAALAHLVRLARAHALPPAFTETCVLLLHAVAALGAEPSDAPHVHVGLAGAFTAVRQLLAAYQTSLTALPDGVGARLVRDLPLLDVASTVRAKRTEAAWKALSSS